MVQKKEEAGTRKEGNKEEKEGRKEGGEKDVGKEGRVSKVQSLINKYVLTEPRASDSATFKTSSHTTGTPKAADRGTRERKKEEKGGPGLLGKRLKQGSGDQGAGRSLRSARGGEAECEEGTQSVGDAWKAA